MPITQKKLHVNAQDSVKKLTSREAACLVLAAQGKTSAETAHLLAIKITTVHTHRRQIKRKFNCNSMAHAVFKGFFFGYFKEIEPCLSVQEVL